MGIIVPNISNADQYLKIQKENPGTLRPARCPGCLKGGLWSHGSYERKTARSSSNQVPIDVPRFYCSHCHKTCSVLPEYISPQRRYLWGIQQIAMVLVLQGKSFRAAAKNIAPSRHTISRWIGRLKERFKLHRDKLCQHFVDLCPIDNFAGFWLACFSKISLSRAMYFCNVAGVDVP